MLSFLCAFSAESMASGSAPLPSRHPETFYASPELLREIKRRMDMSKISARDQDFKAQNDNDDLSVKDADKDLLLRHLQSFHIENF